VYQTYKDRGFLVIQTWAENESSGTPTAEELAEFGGQFGHTFPDVADEGWAINNRFEKDNGIPTQWLLAPGMEVVHGDLDGMVSESEIEEYLPE
jgi:hypothetical protein